MIFIHHIEQTTGESTCLAVSIFVFMNSLFKNLPDDLSNENGGALLLLYNIWEHAGQIQDATILKLHDIVHIIQPCRVQFATSRSNESEFTYLSASSQTEFCDKPEFIVEWAIFAKGILGQGPLKHPIELRKLSNRSNQLVIDSRDVHKLRFPLSVHDYNCGIGGSTTGFEQLGLRVTVAVEANEIASDFWKVSPQVYFADEQKNHSGMIFSEDMDTFLDSYPYRSQCENFQPPSILLMSNLCNGKNLYHVADNSTDQDHNISGNGTPCGKCIAVERMLRTIAVVSPPIVVSELSLVGVPEQHWGSFLKGLQESEYEFRITKLETSEYGCIQSQERAMLVASKIGLPSPLGIDSSDILLICSQKKLSSTLDIISKLKGLREIISYLEVMPKRKSLLRNLFLHR